MPAPRPAKRRKTDTSGMKLLLTAATLSLTVGAWGTISQAGRDTSATAGQVAVAPAASSRDLPPPPRLIVPPAPVAPDLRTASLAARSAQSIPVTTARPAARTRSSR